MKETVVLSGREYLLEKGIYNPMIKENPFERQGGTYKMEKMENGEEVLIPNIQMPKMIEEEKLGKFGKMRLKFLKEEKADDYQMMLMEETLMDHLMKIEDQALDFIMMERLKMMDSWGLTEELQSKDFLKYSGLMKNLDMELDKIVMQKIIWV
ncbi:TnpV protein [Fusobacterium necrophorum]|uniref:TnpV protein n=1 Tax=Fusobacterium necrophorum TaxID=859 RepID=UPI00373AF282